MIFGLKTSRWMLRFLIFVSFCWFFELHAKYGQKLENFVKSWIFCLIWHEIKKTAKIRKNEKTQHLMRCFKSKKQFKINFYNFCQFLAHFEQKVAKNVFFVIFAKTVKIWHYQCIPCEIPFLKMYTFMYFYEFVKKLCYKIKMSKRDV